MHEHAHPDRDRAAVVGVIANPMSGRDVRRLAARAPQQTPESKRNQIQRAVIGAVAGGAGRILMARDCFRISDGAAETLRVDADIEFVDIRIETKPSDTMHAVAAMRDAGARVLLVLGGDGTNRLVAQTWRDAPIIPISTGTNNVFPDRLEATAAGSAAGILASGRIELEEVATPAKVVEAEFEDGHRELALIDCALLADDHPGSLLPFRPAQLRHLVLSRAEPDAVGMSPIGGLFHPCTRDDDFGVDVRCTAPEEGKSTLLVPYSPGLFGNVHVDEARPVELDQSIIMTGPGVIAFDGDRLRALEPGERVTLRVSRSGPQVIDIHRALSLAASRGLFLDRHWHDALDEGGGFECC
jgi:NAD kinase